MSLNEDHRLHFRLQGKSQAGPDLLIDVLTRLSLRQRQRRFFTLMRDGLGVDTGYGCAYTGWTRHVNIPSYSGCVMWVVTQRRLQITHTCRTLYTRHTPPSSATLSAIAPARARVTWAILTRPGPGDVHRRFPGCSSCPLEQARFLCLLHPSPIGAVGERYFAAILGLVAINTTVKEELDK